LKFLTHPDILFDITAAVNVPKMLDALKAHKKHLLANLPDTTVFDNLANEVYRHANLAFEKNVYDLIVK